MTHYAQNQYWWTQDELYDILQAQQHPPTRGQLQIQLRSSTRFETTETISNNVCTTWYRWYNQTREAKKYRIMLQRRAHRLQQRLELD